MLSWLIFNHSSRGTTSAEGPQNQQLPVGRSAPTRLINLKENEFQTVKVISDGLFFSFWDSDYLIWPLIVIFSPSHFLKLSLRKSGIWNKCGNFCN